MKKKEDLVGQRVGRLIVVAEVECRVDNRGDKVRYVKCLCDCGVSKNISLRSLRAGRSMSCGCLQREAAGELGRSRKSVVRGFGVNDYDGLVVVNGVSLRSYEAWTSMINRCYDIKVQAKQPRYKGVIVCKEWKYFSNFKKWFDENYNPEIMQGWHLDKDILVKGNKVYSPETCCFVPREINLLFTKSNNRRGGLCIGVHYDNKNSKYRAHISIGGKVVNLGRYDRQIEAFNAYKDAKCQHIKQVADKWKDKITNNVYQAMLNYKIEITD